MTCDDLITSLMFQPGFEALQYLRLTQLYEPCDEWSPRCPKSHLTDDDVKELAEKGIVIHADESTSAGYVFTVPEETKKRRRVVHDTLSPNVCLPDAPNPAFLSVRRLKKMLFYGTAAVSIDFKCYYYQFSLPRDIQRYFVFVHEGVKWQFTRLPMGFKWAVIIAQMMSQYIVSVVPLPKDVYIDNLLVVGDPGAVRYWANVIDKRCTALGVTIGEVQLGSEVTHRGVLFNFMRKTVQLKDTFVVKFRTRVMLMATWGEVRSVLSAALYGAQVLDYPMSKLFHVLKFMGKYALTHVSTNVQWWAAAWSEFDQLRQFLVANRPHSPNWQGDGLAPQVLITDARRDGKAHIVAAILLDTTTGRMSTVTKAYAKSHDINQLECVAVLEALRAWAPRLRHSRVGLLIDNQAALWSLRKGYARAYHLNTTVDEVEKLTRLHHIELVGAYVPSAENPADALTREVPFSSLHYDCMERLRRPEGWCVCDREEEATELNLRFWDEEKYERWW
jgi:hypothetical protein